MSKTSFGYSYFIESNELLSSNLGPKVCFYTVKTNCPHWFGKDFPRTKIVKGPSQPGKHTKAFLVPNRFALLPIPQNLCGDPGRRTAQPCQGRPSILGPH